MTRTKVVRHDRVLSSSEDSKQDIYQSCHVRGYDNPSKQERTQRYEIPYGVNIGEFSRRGIFRFALTLPSTVPILELQLRPIEGAVSELCLDLLSHVSIRHHLINDLIYRLEYRVDDKH